MNSNPVIPNSRVLAIFTNPESWVWRCPNHKILALQKSVKIILS